MKSLELSRYALAIGAASALLAGCGGSHPPMGAPGAMSQSRAIAQPADRRGSWMLREATGEDLLYATGGCGGTCVLSVSHGDVVGMLNVYGEAVCSDSAGNVYIVEHNAVVKYAHGGTSPIATLSLPGDEGSGCSVDPLTGDLAVVYKGNGLDVAVFPNASGTPALFGSGIDSLFCGYDGHGNLFVDGYSGQSYALSMLPIGSPTFSTLSINQSMGQPGQLQWDGKYITYQARFTPLIVSRFVVSGSKVNIVRVIKFRNLHKRATPSWIHAGNIFIPYQVHGAASKQLGEWKYPKGGKRTMGFSFGTFHDTLNLVGVTYSVAGSR
jgi:hypothetical protein